MIRLFLWSLFILPWPHFANAACNVTGINQETLANLGDLRTPTPYTLTLSAIASGCSTDPTTVTVLYTWEINGTPFIAANSATITYSTVTYVYITVTFPGMTVTSLTPGEPLTLLDGYGDTNVYYVPFTAIPATSTPTTLTSTTSSTSSTTSSPAPPPPSTSNSTPIGGIVAGSVVGGVVVVAILVFGWYKVRTDRPRPIPVPNVVYEDPNYQPQPPQEAYPMKRSINADQEMNEMPGASRFEGGEGIGS